MAKTTKTKPPTGPVLVDEPPEPVAEAVPAQEPEAPLDESDEPSVVGKTEVVETATKEDLDRQKTRRGLARESALGFFSRIQKYQGTAWEKLKLYIYRLAPVTDRTAGGNPVKFLTIYREAIDEEMVLKEWGSGRYRCLLNQTNEKGDVTALDRIEFEIENTNYPPKVPPGEWVDDPRNKRWAWANKDNGVVKTTDGTQVHVSAAPAGPSITELIKGVKDLKELTKEAAPTAPDPVAQLKGTVETVKSLVEMSKPPEVKTADPDAHFANTLTLVKTIVDLMKPKETEKPPDPLSTMAIKLLEKRLEKMDEEPKGETPSERQSRMNGTQELILEITKAAAPVVERAFQFFTVMATAKQQQQRPAATAQQTAVTAAQPAPESQQPPAAQTDTTAASAEQNPPPPTQPTMEQAQQQILNFVLGNATPTLQQYLDNGDDGETSAGTLFAQWFCDTAFTLPGVPPPFNRLSGIDALTFARQFGRDAIIAAYKQNAALYQQIAPNPEGEEKFSRFLDDFLKYDPNAEEDN